VETRVPGVLGKVIFKGFTQSRVYGIGNGDRGLSVDVFRQAGATTEQGD
jgi:hypothetical protein